MTDVAFVDTAHGADSLTILGVGSTAPMPVVPLADLRAHLNWPISKGTADDDELLAMAEACVDTLEGYLSRPVRTAAGVERHSVGNPALLLRRNPCPCMVCMAYRTITITSVVEDGTTLTAADYTLDPEAGLLWRGTTAGYPWISLTPAGVVVTYTAGYTTPPPWVVMAVKRLVEHLWTRSQQSRHSRSGSEAAEAAPVPTYLLPYMVQSLLTPHQAPGW
jgi:hypothetical protein